MLEEKYSQIPQKITLKMRVVDTKLRKFELFFKAMLFPLESSATYLHMRTNPRVKWLLLSRKTEVIKNLAVTQLSPKK